MKFYYILDLYSRYESPNRGMKTVISRCVINDEYRNNTFCITIYVKQYLVLN